MAKRPVRFEIINNVGEGQITLIGGGYFFHVVAGNGRILCHSERYETRRACIAAIRAVQDARFQDGGK